MRPSDQRGQVYPLFGIMLTVLIGTSALSVDVGYYRYQQRQQQAAADSAAIAGAQANFYNSQNSSNAQNAARDDASENGFTNGSGTVTVNVDPTYTDAGNCATSCVQVTITKKYPVFFGSIYGLGKKGEKQIQTVAAAKLQPIGGACWTSLGPTSVTTTANGAKIVGPDCGIADADATTVNGGSADVASWTLNGSATNKCSDPVCVDALPPIDPCSVSAKCQILANATAAELGISSTTATNPTCTVPKTVGASPLSPGCYNCVKTICVFSNVTLSPGLYVITGTAEFDKTVTGTAGVTLYWTQGAQYTDKTNANVNLTAPTSGDFTGFPGYSAGEEGILMYQAKNPKATWKSSIQANINFIGLTYMPNWNVTFNGHSESVTGNFVGNSFTVNGGSSLTLNPGSGTIDGGPSVPTLVE